MQHSDTERASQESTDPGAFPQDSDLEGDNTLIVEGLWSQLGL